MKTVKNFLNSFVLAVGAGICIGVGATVYLLCASKLLGAVLFAVGLCTVLLYSLALFTGMAGYLFDNKPLYLVRLVIVWVGNFIGTAAVALPLSLSRVGPTLSNAALAVVEPKLNDEPLSLIVLGIFCGLLMFIGVDTFKKHWGSKDFSAIFIPVICVAVFILAGFEHCVADMFYFVSAGRFVEGLPCLLWVTLGNVVGGVLLPLLTKFAARLKEQ